MKFHYCSPIGDITLTSSGKALTGLCFGDHGNLEYENDGLPVFDKAVKWLDIYFGGAGPDLILPLELNVTPFCREVLNIVKTIPFGQTMTYGEIADIIAERRGIGRMSAQAVGGAVGRNPIPIIIPCHRVVGADGALTGYSCGIERKLWLLEHEYRR